MGEESPIAGYKREAHQLYRQTMEMLQLFTPGQVVPKSAQYWVIHLKHRLPYKGVISAGETFPSCLHCQVRYEFISKERYSATSIQTDADLFLSS